ncbi:MAG: sulfatase-like hydrolase/transferase [Planctomycetota bacterium]
MTNDRRPNVLLICTDHWPGRLLGCAVGKMHVFPQRDRCGFDDVWLDESGRCLSDDYQMFLADNGHPGEMYLHGCSNNGYEVKPWHLEEGLHQTNWTADAMSRMIKRRDPAKPAFWYLSFAKPHPPLTPPQWYIDLYRGQDIDLPVIGAWAQDVQALPGAVHQRTQCGFWMNDADIRLARAAFYGACTHIDHCLRSVLGTLRNEGLLDDTILVFTSDHGDNLGNHHIWKKGNFHEWSANIPLVFGGKPVAERLGGIGAEVGQVDERLIGQADLMPSLLDLCGLPVPGHVDGISAFGPERRSHVYGDMDLWQCGMRAIIEERFKCLWYPGGNRWQLFDLQEDPDELHDLSGDPAQADTLARMRGMIAARLRGRDQDDWVRDGQLVGMAYEHGRWAGESLQARRSERPALPSHRGWRRALRTVADLLIRSVPANGWAAVRSDGGRPC